MLRRALRRLPLRTIRRSVSVEASDGLFGQAPPSRAFHRIHVQVRETCKDRVHYFVHAGNAIVLLAISQTDMLHLRVLMVVASTFGLAYNLLQPCPLFAPASWGLFFISCHCYYIAQLLKDRQPIVLGPDQEQVYESGFFRFGFTPRQFCDLLEASKARWCTFGKGTWLHRTRTPLLEVDLLIEGQVEIYDPDGHLLRTASPGKGAWLGEVYDPQADLERWEQHDKHTTRSNSYRCVSEVCRTLALARREMHAFLRSNAKLHSLASEMQVDDLWGKLKGCTQQQKYVTYRQMLQVALSDGVLATGERDLLEAWRSQHGLTEEEHHHALEDLGWTAAEYRNGRKRRFR